MSMELISKKDLLDLTGISYGQLYRWKRKDLIPEEWFIRKSTFTGQETFFPKEKILERIKKIQTMKENLSLDELADMFSPSVGDFRLSAEELIQRNIVSKLVLDFYINENTNGQVFTFDTILQLYIIEKLLQAGDISLDEGKMLSQILSDYHDQVQQKNSELIFIRKLGISSCLITNGAESIQFEKGTKVIVRLSLAACAEELKTKLI
ncbi:YhbD family protein [Bacillus sp. CGMCC 1.16607]|uniref:YhbD family protein n=1 Tax=Bacillus sp. CGMCC 1.16607 TaxID=3351842 RepID=UPI00362BB55F